MNVEYRESKISQIPGGTKTNPSSNHERIFQTGQIQLSISHGDITQTSVEAIVNGSNGGLDLTQGAISKAILQAAGDKLQLECRAKVSEMKQCGVTVTGGGKMKCKYVIHVDAQRKSQWKQKITICLDAANSLGVQSIAFPAVGTGGLELKSGEFAENLLKAITSFQKELTSPCTIQKIHVIVFQKEMVSSISGRLTDYCHKAGSESQSLFQKLVSWIPGANQFQTKEDKFDSAEVKVPKILSLVIYSDEEKNIQDAMANIEETMRREEIIKLIGDAWTYIIKLLSDEEVASIRKLETVDSVTIEIQKTVGRIQVQGMSPDVLSAHDKIISLLQEKQAKTHEERVQNVSLYKQYLAFKCAMDKAEERLLWHGTSSATTPSINLYGFDRSHSGKNATAFGDGVYFAANAQYSISNTYSTPDAAGHKRVYQCKVLVGEYTLGAPGMKVRPNKSGHILYDSVVDNLQTPSIFVIFQDAQAYPEYLITFK